MKKLLFAVIASGLFFLSVQPSYALFGQKRARAEAEQKAKQAAIELDKVKKQAEENQRKANEKLLATQHTVIIGLIVVVVGVSIYICTHQRTIQQVVIVRTPAHEIVVDSVVIDATNVVRFSQGQSPSLLRLIGVLLELQKRKYTYKCFFDANMGYVLQESGLMEEAKAYRQLLQDFGDIFIEVPGRTKADDFILDYAHNHGTPIISNDRYREYVTKYPWIDSASDRRVPFAVHSTLTQLRSLGIEAKVPNDLNAALNEYRGMLRSGQN